MRSVLGHRNAGRLRSDFGRCLRLFALLSPTLLHAQAPTVDASQQFDPSLTTLHVYTTRLQTVALVLDAHDHVPPLDPQRFRLSLDQGPFFAPSSVHMAEHDPLSIGILVDVSGRDRVLPLLPHAVGALRAGPLTATDTLQVYATDCTTLRTNISTANVNDLTEAVDTMLNDTRLHDRAHPTRTCAGKLQLWDATARAITALAKLPGRRVLLLVSDGSDRNSHLTLDQLRLLADDNAVAIFAMPFFPGGDEGPARFSNTPPPLEYLTSAAGGLVLDPPRHNPAQAFADFVSMLRHRYVLEFSRPRFNATDGQHQLAVQLKGRNVRIRATGTSTPLVDSVRLRDSSTISEDGAQGGALATPSQPPATGSH